MARGYSAWLLVATVFQAAAVADIPAETRWLTNRIFCVDSPGAFVVKDDQSQSVRLVSGPVGARIIDEQGIFVWCPCEDQVGSHAVAVEVTQDGKKSVRQYAIEVKPLERVLFVLAHSDDEFPIFSKLIDLVQSGVEVRCLWLVNSRTRQQESTEAMTSLGIPVERLFFEPERLGTVESLKAASDVIGRLLSEHRIDQVFTLGYECGHNQHDMTHFCTVDAVLRMGFKGQVYEYGLYNMFAGRPNLFSLIPAAMPSIRFTQSEANVELIESLIPIYASQKHVTSLFDLALTSEQRRNTLYRPVPRWDFTRRPYQGILWYELRANSPNDNFKKVSALVREYLETHPRTNELPGIFEQDRPKDQLGLYQQDMMADPRSAVSSEQE